MKRSSTAKAVPTKRQAAGALAKLAKAHGKTKAEIELDAVKVLSRANAAEVERLRAERDALAPDAADYQQQREAEVLVAQLTDQPVPMPLRPAQALRMLRRTQAANADLASRADVTSRLDKLEQAVAEGNRGTAVLLKRTETKPRRISFNMAADIWRITYPPIAETYKMFNGHTIANWMREREGKMPKAPGFTITEQALASKETFVHWLLKNYKGIGLNIRLQAGAMERLEALR